ncbi:MAG: hypothetical protein ACLTDV_07470 [Eubacterium sp.]
MAISGKASSSIQTSVPSYASIGNIFVRRATQDDFPVVPGITESGLTITSGA